MRITRDRGIERTSRGSSSPRNTISSNSAGWMKSSAAIRIASVASAPATSTRSSPDARPIGTAHNRNAAYTSAQVSHVRASGSVVNASRRSFQRRMARDGNVALMLRQDSSGKMRSTVHKLAALFVSLMACAAMASAQQRPLDTQDPETIGAGRVLVEGGISGAHDITYPLSGFKGNLWQLPVLGLNVGLSSIADLQITGGPYNYFTITSRQPGP